MKLKAMKENSDTEFVLEKNLEKDIVLDEQSNYVLTPEVNIYLAEDRI